MAAPHRLPVMRRVPFPICDAEDDSANAAAVQLPPGHFLASAAADRSPSSRHQQSPSQAEVTAQRGLASSTSDAFDTADSCSRPDTSSLAAADYDVSVLTGFLPPDEPVARLDSLDDRWRAYELCLDHARDIVSRMDGGGLGRLPNEWRTAVEQLPKAPIELLTTLPLTRRAHVLLSFLGHFYVHSSFPSIDRVPASIAEPWCIVSDKLGIPPILTYADTVLWNWRYVDPALGMRPDNLVINTRFTKSPSEHAFFMLSLLCELYGPHILRLMSATLDEAFFADSVSLGRIASYLGQISSSIDELSLLMRAATKGVFGPGDRETITPAVFYWEIRPWFNGGKWMYEGVGPQGSAKEMEWGGPSAGQSSLVHAIDVFLGVDHSPRPASGTPAASSSSSSSSASSSASPTPPPSSNAAKPVSVPLSDSTFMLRMSHYMPGFHRQFLHHLSSLHVPSPSKPFPVPSVRQLAQRHPLALGPAYDAAVHSMKLFRDEHMRLATVFIVSQARREPGRDTVFWPAWEAKRLEREAAKVAAAVAHETDQKRLKQRETEMEALRAKAFVVEAEREQLKGTGGTDLVVFLKRCRDRTREALLEQGQ